MREVVSVTIEGQTYKIKPLATTISLRIMSRLVKLVGGPIGEALKSGNGFMDKELTDSLPIVGTVINAITERLDEEIVLNTIKELLSTVIIVNGDKEKPLSAIFEIHFEGRIFHLLKLVKEVLEVNYGDFFEGITGLKSKLGQVMGQAD